MVARHIKANEKLSDQPYRQPVQDNFTNNWRQPTPKRAPSSLLEWPRCEGGKLVKRKRRRSLKGVFDAILYLLKTGCQWRMLPSDFPNWKLVYYYFCKWSRDGTLEEINDALRNKLREKRGRKRSPSVGIIDSQSVKTTKASIEATGWDGGKKIKGRKRHIITDTQGLLLGIDVHSANEHDSKAAFRVLEQLKWRFERMKKIYADGGYRGELVDRVKNELGYDMEITLRTDKSTDFKPLPKRWIVERTFSWFENFRRLAKDYERTCCAAKNMIYLAFIALMIKFGSRLVK